MISVQITTESVYECASVAVPSVPSEVSHCHKERTAAQARNGGALRFLARTSALRAEHAQDVLQGYPRGLRLFRE